MLLSLRVRTRSSGPLMLAVITLIAMAANVVPALADEGEQAEFKKLEGSWDVTAMEVSGMRINPPKGAPDQIVFKAGRITLMSGGKALDTVTDLLTKIDPKASPKTIDLIRGANEQLPCLYEVSATEFKLAMPLVPKEYKKGDELKRPLSLNSKGQPVIVLLAKRKS